MNRPAPLQGFAASPAISDKYSLIADIAQKLLTIGLRCSRWQACGSPPRRCKRRGAANAARRVRTIAGEPRGRAPSPCAASSTVSHPEPSLSMRILFVIGNLGDYHVPRYEALVSAASSRGHEVALIEVFARSGVYGF